MEKKIKLNGEYTKEELQAKIKELETPKYEIMDESKDSSHDLELHFHKHGEPYYRNRLCLAYFNHFKDKKHIWETFLYVIAKLTNNLASNDDLINNSIEVYEIHWSAQDKKLNCFLCNTKEIKFNNFAVFKDKEKTKEIVDLLNQHSKAIYDVLFNKGGE